MNVWQQIDADARCAAIHDTWGHLGPEDGVHHGQMLVAHSTYGDVIVVDELFPTFQNSPWQFEALNRAAFELIKDEDVGVYSLVGYVKWGQDEDDPDATSMTHYEFEIVKVVREFER